MSNVCCRAYSCITGEPSVADILSGGPLPASICTCSEAWYCSLVTAGNFTVPASGQPASGTISGGLAPLPFESLRNAPESQLRCFRGGLGQATDTYNVSEPWRLCGTRGGGWLQGRPVAQPESPVLLLLLLTTLG